MAANPQGQPQSSGQQDARRFIELSKFKGINTSGSPLSIPDDELQWVEELIPVSGTLRQVPAPSSTLLTLAAPVVKLWGYTINDVPYLCAACSNNELYFINLNTNAVDGTAAISSPAGTDVTIWQGTTILVISGNGYQSFNGSTVTSIATGTTGSAITVFSSRVWIGSGRTVQFSAPGSYTDFTVSDAAGSFVITDSAFIGNITALYSALEQLWIFGQNAINVLSNVTVVSSTSTTVFSNSNLSNMEGCYWPRSIAPQLRSLTFANPNGVYMLTGLTPQKNSLQLDGVFNNMNDNFNVHSGVATIFSEQWLCYLLDYTGTQGNGAGPIIFLYSPKTGWGTSRQGGNLSSVTTAWINGTPTLFGASGANIIQLFESETTKSAWSMTTKLYDMNQSATIKEMYRIGAFMKQGAGGNSVMTTVTEDGYQFAEPIGTNTGTKFYKTKARGFGRGVGVFLSGGGYGTQIYSVSFQAEPRSEW